MMWSRFTATLFFLASGISGAQSANDSVAALESCFQVARVADTICSKLPNDPTLRLDCLQKTRAAQLQCLEHVLSEAHAAPPVSQESLGSQSAAAAQESRPKDTFTKQTGHTGAKTTPTESSRLWESNNPPIVIPKTNPAEQPGSSPSADATGSTTIPTEDRLLQKSDSPTAASSATNLPDRSPPPTDAAASDRFSKDVSTGLTGDTEPTTTLNERGLQDHSPPAATPKPNPLELSSPTTDTADRSSPDVSIEKIGGARPQAVSTENPLFPESKGPPNVTTGTNEQASSLPRTNTETPPNSGDAALSQATPTPSPATSADSGPHQQSESALKSPLATNPTGPAPSPTTAATVAGDSSKEILPEPIGDTKSPAAPTVSHPPEDSNTTPKVSLRPDQRQRPEANEATTGAISAVAPLKPVAQSTRPISGDWVVSETTSPIDYSPLVTAVIRSTLQVKDAPNALTIRCRGKRTELVVHADGAWRTPRGSEMQGAYQIDDQPAVSQRWIRSPDGKSATYKDDVVGLLQSLPDSARFKINIADQTSPSHEATFRLDSLDAVRRRIAKACQWSLTADKGLPQRR